jgi:hypothetical protein
VTRGCAAHGQHQHSSKQSVCCTSVDDRGRWPEHVLTCVIKFVRAQPPRVMDVCSAAVHGICTLMSSCARQPVLHAHCTQLCCCKHSTLEVASLSCASKYDSDQLSTHLDSAAICRRSSKYSVIMIHLVHQ